MDDLSSGYNIDWNISVDPRFNAMMGFDETEVREMFHYYQQNDMLNGDVEAMIAEMKLGMTITVSQERAWMTIGFSIVI